MKKIITVVIVAIVAAFSLSACSSSSGMEMTRSVEDRGVVVSNGGYNAAVSVEDIPIPGGGTVPCAVVLGYNKAGISCDWENAQRN